MTWSPSQRKLVFRACQAAQWDDATRYLVMRNVGCPVSARTDRPSLTANNQQHSFERFMELAERAAFGLRRDALMPTPRDFATWEEACAGQYKSEIATIRKMFDEACERVPAVFGHGSLGGFVRRMTRENTLPIGLPTNCLSECTGAQLYRIHEGAKAWIGREFWSRDIAPRTFVIPARVRGTRKERASAEAEFTTEAQRTQRGAA